jgi:hypothetical protein
MSIDMKKLTAADLKKLAESTKQSSGADTKAALEKARKATKALEKDVKVLADMAKNDPKV